MRVHAHSGNDVVLGYDNLLGNGLRDALDPRQK
jgi:hypothetical protein